MGLSYNTVTLGCCMGKMALWIGARSLILGQNRWGYEPHGTAPVLCAGCATPIHPPHPQGCSAGPIPVSLPSRCLSSAPGRLDRAAEQKALSSPGQDPEHPAQQVGRAHV